MSRLLAAVVAAFAFGAAASAADSLTIYSARHYDTDQSVYEAFTEATGIEIDLVESKAGKLLERLESEGANSPADVLITVDAGNLWQAEQAGLFHRVSSETLEDHIAPNLRHPDGLWFGFSLRARCIYVREDGIDPSEVATYERLADERFRGEILVRSSSNIYNQSLVASWIAAHGEEAARRMVADIVENFARKPQSNDTGQLKALAAGEGGIAIANSYYYARLLRSDDEELRAVADKIRIVFPNQGEGQRGAHVNISGAGVLAASDDKAAAVKFLEFLTGPEAQRMFADGNNEYPAVDGIEPNETLAGLGEFARDAVDAAELGRNNAAAIAIMDEAGWR